MGLFELAEARSRRESDRTRFVAEFLGSSNIFSGRVIGAEGPNTVVERITAAAMATIATQMVCTLTTSMIWPRTPPA